MSNTASSIEVPSLTLEAAPEYVIGLPLVVAVTVANRTTYCALTAFPECDVLSWSAPFTFVLDDGQSRLSLGGGPSGEPPIGPPLGPGALRRMLFDLSALDPPLRPGSYALHAEVEAPDGTARSNVVRVDLAAPTLDEAKLVALGSEGWIAFLGVNWRTIDVPSASERAARQLALHLFVHRTIYARPSLAELPPTVPGVLRQGLFAPEAALFELELARARHAPDLARRADELRRRWPALAFRASAVERGEGLLTTLRREAGAESRRDLPLRLPYDPP